MKKLFLALAMVCVAAGAAAQGEVLRFDLKKGDVFNHGMATSVKMAQERKGQALNVETDITGDIRYEVVDIVDGDYVMDVGYTRLAMNMKVPGALAEISGNSDTPEAGDMFSPILAAMTGRYFTMTMSPSGRVVGIDNVENLYAGFAEMEGFGSLPPEAAQKIIDQVKEAYGTEKLKSNFYMSMAAFPETPVAVGDSWTTEDKVNMGMSMAMELTTTYTLVERTAGRIVIKAETDVKTEDGQIEANGVQIGYDLDGTMTSDITLDPDTRWTLMSMSTMGINGSITVFQNEQIPSDMTIPMKMEVVVTYTAL